MAKQNSNAQWATLDIETLPKTAQAHYAHYKKLYTQMKEQRECFEQGMRDLLKAKTPAGKRIVFGYNFGKLSIAMVDDDVKVPKTKGVLDFATLLS